MSPLEASTELAATQQRMGGGSRPWPTCDLGGNRIDLVDEDTAVRAIFDRLGGGDAPLAVVSANLDHLHHFGFGARWHGVLEDAAKEGGIDLLTLLDGMPLVKRAERLTGRRWPRLAGSDLIEPILDEAERTGASIGFLGGSPETQRQLREAIESSRPGLRTVGWWAPPRRVLDEPGESAALAREIAAAGADILVVGLGKPRQELWIAEHARATGARVLLAFGAVVDFLAGTVTRCPSGLSRAGFEWTYRLAREPRRLSRRYLVDGPPAYAHLRTSSAARIVRPGATDPRDQHVEDRTATKPVITVVVVTYNNVEHIGHLLQDLDGQVGELELRTVVVDNGSEDGTVDLLAREPDVTTIRAGGNLGYAGGINRAMEEMRDDSDALLVLNPDLRVAPDAVGRLWRRLQHEGVGAVVPLMTDGGQVPYHSLRFEPSLSRHLGDAVFGSHLRGRPEWMTETDWHEESYKHAHPIDWATGACVMITAAAARSVGPWDEQYFLYSEEVDLLRRIRGTGWTVWFEPAAVVEHEGGGSGSSPELAALMTVNKVRYGRSQHGRVYGSAVRAIALTSSLVRLHRADSRRAARYLVSERHWKDLPAATRSAPAPDPDPRGSVVIPAHNEASVLRRSLAPISEAMTAGSLEVLVSANGCTDDTVSIASAFRGVTVLDRSEPSKVDALNAADSRASRWPRLYLDADIEITPRAIAEVFDALDDRSVLAARPRAVYDTAGASWAVRAFYRARGRLPVAGAHLWGAGAYALSEAGHARLGRFPALTADDLYVDSLFTEDEKRIVATDPVIVRTPRTAEGLLAVLARTYRGNAEVVAAAPSGGTPAVRTGATARQLLRSAVTPARALDALTYCCLVLAARRRYRRASSRWERDETSREGVAA